MLKLCENLYYVDSHLLNHGTSASFWIWTSLSIYLCGCRCHPGIFCKLCPLLIHVAIQESNENLEDASNELILTDEEVVRFQIGEVFAHVPKEEVESRIEEMKEVTSKNLEKLEEEKESILAQMAELKQILYGKFKDSINLEED